MATRRVRGWLEPRRPAEDRTLAAPTVEPTFTFPGTTAPLNVSTGNVLAVSDAWACVQLLANSISTLPLHAYRRTPTGRVAAGDNARIARLLEQPTPGSTGVDLVSQIVVHLAVFGEAFLAKYKADGEIVQLGLIHPDSVQVEMKGQTIIYTLSLRTGQVDVGPDDVCHIKGLSVDGLRGLSPVRQCRTALGLASSLQQSAKSFTDHGSRPSGVLTAPNANPAALQQIQEKWQTRHGGVENQHRVAVVSGEIKFEPIAFSQSDQEFLGQREMATREVARVFGIPSWAIGGASGDSLTYASVTQQSRALVDYALRPWATRIERAISSDSTLCPGGTYVQFSFDAFLRGDAQARADTYTLALGDGTHPGWMTRGEVRELEDLPPEDQ